MTPVDELMLRPDGREPLVMLQELDAPPALAGVMVLIAVFLVNVYGPP